MAAVLRIWYWLLSSNTSHRRTGGSIWASRPRMVGSSLNEGLMAYKEGFGARSVNYDTYELVL